jgi:hypothetical protein
VGRSACRCSHIRVRQSGAFTISGVAEAAWCARGVSKRRDRTVGVQTSDLNSCGMNSICTTLYVIPVGLEH